MSGERWCMVWLVAALLLPSVALAQDDEEDEDLIVIEEEETQVDSLEIYRAFKKEMAGLPVEEELDAWHRYLRTYPKSAYKREIEARIEQLEEAMLEEAEADAPSYFEDDIAGGRGAKYDEIPFVEPFGFLSNNTRKKVHLALAYGYNQTFNYDLGLEYAIKRNLSVYGHARHWRYGIGILIEAGLKYAMVKDTRTGALVVAGMSIKGGADHGMHIGVDPYFGIGVNPANKPVTFQFQVGYDMRFTPWGWDLHLGANLGLRPSETVVIFFEGTGHNTARKMLAWDAPAGEECGDEGAGDEHCTTEYYAFYEAAAGVKVQPRENIEVTVALRAPVFYRKWLYYNPLGGGASVMIYF